MTTGSVKFDRAAGYYDQTRGFPPGVEAQAAALIARVGGLNANSRILEIGVGTGRIALPLSGHVRAIYGIDLSRPMMDRLREKRRGEAIVLAESDAARLPFPPRCFDAVVAVHVFHLIPAWREVLGEIARVLKTGAPLIIAWNGYLFRDVYDELARIVPETARVTGVDFEDTGKHLEAQGWQAQTPPASIRWMAPLRLAELPEKYERRTSSQSWQMNDEAIKRAGRELRRLLVERFGDLEQPQDVERRFSAQAYLPPATRLTRGR